MIYLVGSYDLPTPKNLQKQEKMVDHNSPPSQVSKERNVKKGGPEIWWRVMIYLPLPFCRNKRFWPNMVESYDLPLFLKKRGPGRS